MKKRYMVREVVLTLIILTVGFSVFGSLMAIRADLTQLWARAAVSALAWMFLALGIIAGGLRFQGKNKS
ncbi:MAG: hypothetical protein JO316_12035 [Abitibacteriaceae bacterium]|nr:hypothetical protein [Abditibacteriaceae bacterium]MBV9866073.1 hypothetical protein [Abditibacteriaceae bacterium]